MDFGWIDTFAQREHLALTVIMFPSGSSQVSLVTSTKKIHRDGENAVSSLQMSASNFMTSWAECVVESVGSFTREICVEHYFDAIEAFSADSGDLSLREHVGLFVI